MIRFNSLLLAGLTAGTLVASADAATLIVFPAAPNGATLAPSFVGTGVTGVNLARGSGLAQATGSTFNSNNFTIGGSSFASAVTNGDFLTFGFTSTQAYDLTDMDIRYDRSSTGPNNAQLQIAINGGAFVPFFTDNAVSDSGEDNLGISLSSFDNVTSATFRLPAFGASGSTGTFDIETINFGGGGTVGIEVRGTASPSAVPEPASLGLIGLAGTALLGRRRRA
jgi:hypothetical protein